LSGAWGIVRTEPARILRDPAKLLHLRRRIPGMAVASR
jgi:hypothetical protein